MSYPAALPTVLERYMSSCRAPKRPATLSVNRRAIWPFSMFRTDEPWDVVRTIDRNAQDLSVIYLNQVNPLSARARRTLFLDRVRLDHFCMIALWNSPRSMPHWLSMVRDDRRLLFEGSIASKDGVWGVPALAPHHDPRLGRLAICVVPISQIKENDLSVTYG